jgi:transcription elongation factor Elf1
MGTFNCDICGEETEWHPKQCILDIGEYYTRCLCQNCQKRIMDIIDILITENTTKQGD